VDDLIEAFIRLMATPAQVTGPINLGNPEEFTILQLATLVVEMTGSRSRIVHHPKPEDDPRQRRPDVTAAKRVLDWSPRTPLKDGLKSTIGYFDELLKDDGVRARLTNGSPK
jgi:UDP-glucuronate decarboxylase